MKKSAVKLPAEFAALGPEEIQRALLNILEDLEAANARLRTEFSRTQVVLETMGSALVSLSPRGAPEVANQEAIIIFGWEKGLPQRSLVTREPFASVIAACGKDLTRRCESEFTAGGRKFKVIGKAIALEKSIKGYVVVLTDITREKELERLKTEFVSIASHQLRTPISAIKWIIELLLHGDAGPLTPEQREFLSQARESNERMVALINDLLDVSRIEGGRFALAPVEVDLAVLTTHVTREFEESIRRKDLEFSVRSPRRPVRVIADPKYLHQAMSNLLSNAVKYTAAGGSVTIEMSALGGEALWSVTDTGMGIPLHQQPRVFQKFFRGDNVIREETEGTGLGLYVAKSILEAMGGRIWFRSVEKKGSTFTFSLPLLRAQSAR